MELRSRDSSHRHGVHAKRQERDEHPTVRERERRCRQTADNLTNSPSSERALRSRSAWHMSKKHARCPVRSRRSMPIDRPVVGARRDSGGSIRGWRNGRRSPRGPDRPRLLARPNVLSPDEVASKDDEARGVVNERAIGEGQIIRSADGDQLARRAAFRDQQRRLVAVTRRRELREQIRTVGRARGGGTGRAALSARDLYPLRVERSLFGLRRRPILHHGPTTIDSDDR
jgi:hypothetical protein